MEAAATLVASVGGNFLRRHSLLQLSLWRRLCLMLRLRSISFMLPLLWRQRLLLWLLLLLLRCLLPRVQASLLMLLLCQR